MRKIFGFLMILLAGISQTGCEYDDAGLWDEMEDVKNRVTALEKAVEKTNSNIEALQAIVEALQKNVYVTTVQTTSNGYIISFSDGSSATISNGIDGKDGINGTNAPVISVKLDSDGNYYWTIDGEWLLVNGSKVRANGIDGEDGKDGVDGKDGENGADAVAPKVRINENSKEWEISTDGGETWMSTGIIADGKDGINGTNAPVISVKLDSDGNYYWTIDGEWLLVNGSKVRANGIDGEDGKDGVDGKDGENGADAVAPKVRINENSKEWEISTDGGDTWMSTGIIAEGKDGSNGTNGSNGSNGDSLFKSVDTSDSNYILITLADGTELKLARYDETAPLFVILEAPAIVQVEYGKSVAYAVKTERVADYTINTPECWKAVYAENVLTITAPAKDLCHFDKNGTIAVTVVSAAGKSAIVKLNVVAGEWIEEAELRTLTFEDNDVKFSPFILDYADGYAGREISKWSQLIDTPQYNGPLMYGNDQMDAMYFWYDEGNTELYHMFPDNYAYCYWGGGHAISNYWGAGYTDDDRNKHIAKYYGEDYLNQWAGKPGADGALGWFLLQLMTPIAPHSGENFCVHYGYKDFFSYIENLPELSFADGVARVIDHMYVTNTNYTLNQLYNGVKSEEGNNFGGNWNGLTEEAWLKIVAYGYDSADADPTTDEPTSETEFYLVRGFDVVEDWQKWDLSVLGEVAKVRFNFLYSDEMGGRYGFTIPGYFAYDDIAVRFGNKRVFK